MNLNLFDDMGGLVLREREAALKNSMSSHKSAMNGNTDRFPSAAPLAMAYVPFQQWGQVYSEDDALCKGTLFPDLDFPFERGGSFHE